MTNPLKWLQIILGISLFIVYFLLVYLEVPLSPYTLYNPSVFGIFITTFFFLILPTSQNFQKKKYLTLILLFSIVAINVYLQSRIGLLCFVFGLLLHVYRLKKKIFSSFVVFLFLSIVCILYFTFYSKFNSTVGRSFIVKNCFQAFKKSSFNNNSSENFRKIYNIEQINYFQLHGTEDSKQLVAGNVYYVLNEWLQLSLEIGIIKTISILFIVLIFFCIFFIRECKDTNSNNFNLFCSSSMLLFGSFFSYPFYHIPTFFLIIYLVVTMICILFKNNAFYILLIFLLYFLYNLKIEITSRIYWKNALQEYSVSRSIKKSFYYYKLAYLNLSNNPDFLKDYSTLLISIEKYDEAKKCLLKGFNICGDYDTNIQLALLYKFEKNYSDAEKHFLNAFYLIPSKFKAPFLLMKLSEEQNDINKVKKWAEYIVQKKAKIPSVQIVHMQYEASKLLKNKF